MKKSILLASIFLAAIAAATEADAETLSYVVLNDRTVSYTHLRAHET